MTYSQKCAFLPYAVFMAASLALEDCVDIWSASRCFSQKRKGNCVPEAQCPNQKKDGIKCTRARSKCMATCRMCDDDSASSCAAEIAENEELKAIIASMTSPPPPLPVAPPIMTASYVSVADDYYPDEVSWSLSCGDGTYISGGANYYGDHEVEAGSSCELAVVDSFGDGWSGATWEAPEWTDNTYTASGSGSTYYFTIPMPSPPMPPPSPPMLPPSPPPPSPSPSPPPPPSSPCGEGMFRVDFDRSAANAGTTSTSTHEAILGIIEDNGGSKCFDMNKIFTSRDVMDNVQRDLAASQFAQGVDTTPSTGNYWNKVCETFGTANVWWTVEIVYNDDGSVNSFINPPDYGYYYAPATVTSSADGSVRTIYWNHASGLGDGATVYAAYWYTGNGCNQPGWVNFKLDLSGGNNNFIHPIGNDVYGMSWKVA